MRQSNTSTNILICFTWVNTQAYCDINTFIKVDVEGFECVLIPAIAEWLMAALLKPTVALAMHASIGACTADQYANITHLVRAYAYVTCADGSGPHPLESAALETSTIAKLCPTGELLLSDHMAAADSVE